ncbi:butyrophilin-like protein 2 isoform X3 [Sciurus carolinensis]|uniref:butyrophilin-like protein 2 isoform X3 n=1 Tax=Sciurus carolinensis TaxID=30640 RepID=UPI001FB2C7A0|nr:butyrophilin-like protein 2 isoform X3 [Sciurus carolinensis]
MVDLPGHSLSGVIASFLFILLTMKQSDDFRVIGPAYPILTRVGEDALLTCQLFPKRTAMHMKVKWYRTEPDMPAIAHWDGVEMTEMQMEEYRDRIEWIDDSIADGNVTLKIHNIQPSDNGQYWCQFQEGNYHKETSLLLKVAKKLQTELASLKVIGPSQPILVRVGEDIQLTCYLFPKANAQSMEVRWVQAHHYPAVYVYMNGDHVAREQMVDYRGRTALMSDAIHEGRLTLQIQNARTSDDGQYQCLFEKDGVYQKASLDLKVVAVGSSPRITMEVLTDGEIQLMCTSNGWFPQPQMQWRDMEGKTIPSISEILHSDSHGLFHVETSLLIPNSSMANVTCSISNLPLGEEKKAAFTLSESRMAFSWTILPVLGLLFAMVIGLIRRKNCEKVNMTLDPNTAHSKLILSEEHEGMTHDHSCSQTFHRDLTLCSTCWAIRGSHLGGGTERWRSGMGQDGSLMSRTMS